MMDKLISNLLKLPFEYTYCSPVTIIYYQGHNSNLPLYIKQITLVLFSFLFSFFCQQS